MSTVFVVPRAHRRKAIYGCHLDAGHQGQNRMVSLFLERFWWPGMTLAVKIAVKQCEQCIKHEDDGGKAALVPIIASGPMDLLHLNFTKIEMSGNNEKELKKKPEIVNVLMIARCICSILHSTSHSTYAAYQNPY